MKVKTDVKKKLNIFLKNRRKFPLRYVMSVNRIGDLLYDRNAECFCIKEKCTHQLVSYEQVPVIEPELVNPNDNELNPLATPLIVKYKLPASPCPIQYEPGNVIPDNSTGNLYLEPAVEFKTNGNPPILKSPVPVAPVQVTVNETNTNLLIFIY